jgi:ABC-type sugar transport system ATPase subunit
LASIQLESISLQYRGKQVLQNVDLTVEDKELCTLVGPSGCGKSQILRVIAGLVKPSSGNVYFDGELANNIRPGDRDIAMVFQRFALYPHMSVKDNWTFPLKAARLADEEIDERVRTMSDLLEMGLLLDRRPSQLSGGQQQRAALGRALVRRPKIFLMDEPLGSQDAKKRVSTATSLKKLQMDLGITMVCVTSDQIEAQALGDKLAVTDVGTIMQHGTPEEVYERPSNVFVAEFIGSPPINLFDCSLQRTNGQLFLANPQFRLALPSEMATRVEAEASSGAITLGVRPEHVHVAAIKQPDSIPAQVYVLEPRSNVLLIDLHMGDLIVRTRTDREDLGFEPELDQEVYLKLDTGLLHLFDGATGMRIG